MLTEIKLTAVDDAETNSILAKLDAAFNGTAAVIGGGTEQPPMDINAIYFPANPGLAKFPSPEGSAIYAAVASLPYIKDAQAAIIQFAKDATGASVPSAVGGFRLLINSLPLEGVVQAIIAQGQLYFTDHTGHIQKLEAADAVNSGNLNVGVLPPFWSDPLFGSTPQTSTGSGAVTGGVPMPADPPAGVLPGSSGKIINFGAGSPFMAISAALAVAAPGDTVKVTNGAPFLESFTVPAGVLIDGGGRHTDFVAGLAAAKADNIAGVKAQFTGASTVDGTTLADAGGYAHQLGGIVCAGNARIVGFEIFGFGNQEPVHGGTAGIRAQGNCIGFITIDSCFIHTCQNGVGPTDAPALIVLAISNTIIMDCGMDTSATDAGGGAHNVYAGTAVVRDTYGPNFYSISRHLPNNGGGHALKTRSHQTTFIGQNYLQGNDSSALDMPNGQGLPTTISNGTTIEQAANAGNHTVIGNGTENQNNGVAGVNVTTGATIIDRATNPNVLSNGPITFAPGVIFLGTAKLASSGSVAPTGIQPPTGA